MKVTNEMYQKLAMPTYRAGIAMSSAHRQLRALKQQILKPHGLSMAQWSILGIVYDSKSEAVTLSEIAKQLSATQAFVSSNVQALEDKDLIKRQINPNDRRVSEISLNNGMASTVEEIEAGLREQLRETIYANVSRDELAVFLHVLTIFSEDD